MSCVVGNCHSEENEAVFATAVPTIRLLGNLGGNALFIELGAPVLFEWKGSFEENGSEYHQLFMNWS